MTRIGEICLCGHYQNQHKHQFTHPGRGYAPDPANPVAARHHGACREVDCPCDQYTWDSDVYAQPSRPINQESP